MNKIKTIHFIGIKGVGVAPLAIIAKEAGFSVSGSDTKEDFITSSPLSKKGIVPLVGFSARNIKNADLVITTGAHGGFDNIEALEAKRKEIPIWTQGRAVGEFMKGDIFNRHFEGISVLGSHGKTTTTAILATILKDAGFDPSFLIGTGDIPFLEGPGHYGKGKYFVAEADEYATEPRYDKTPKLLWQHPKIAIVTNIEMDHPDLYKSEDEIRRVFLKFANQLPTDGVLIASLDDSEAKKLLFEYKGRRITFGFSNANDVIIKKVSVSPGQIFFWVSFGNTSFGEFVVNVSGEFNAFNALGAVVAALELGLPIDKIKKGLIKFRGTKRRFEYIGKLPSGTVLFDDYAHHPTEIKKTLNALKHNFPKAKIVCIFQPHTYSRTKVLFDEFTRSFNDADTVVLTDIYPSLREEPDKTFSSKLLADRISGFHKEVIFLPKLYDVIEYIKQKNYQKDTVVITMGAGDVYKISSKLKVQNSKI